MVRVISWSLEGDTKSALGDVPKVFILAEATLSIRTHTLRGNPCQGAANTLAGINFLLLIIELDYIK